MMIKFVGFILCCYPLSAQRANFVQYNRSNGFPSQHTWSIYQDHAGYMYFGTDDGLVRYDGLRHEVFHETHGLPATPVLAIAESNGLLWLATPRGLGTFDGTGVTAVNNPGRHFFRAIAVTDDGKVWAGADQGLWVIDRQIARQVLADMDVRSLCAVEDKVYVGTATGETWVMTQQDEPVRLGDALDVVRGLAWYESQLFVSSNAGMFTWTESKGWQRFPSARDLLFSSMACDPAGRLWVGTWGQGIVRLDPSTGTATLYDTHHNLPSPFITDSFCDFEGNLWFSARDGGVVKLSQEEFTYYDLGDPHLITNIAVDGDDHIWAMVPEQGLMRLNSQNNHFDTTIAIEPVGATFSLFIDSRHRVHLLRQRGISVINDDSRMDLDLQPTRNGYFRWGFESALGIFYGGSSGLAQLVGDYLVDRSPDDESQMYHGLELSDSQVAFAARNGIWLFDGRTFTFLAFPREFDGEPHQLVRGTGHGFYVCTDRGLLIRNEFQWRWLLTNRSVMAALADDTGIWLATRNELIKIVDDRPVERYKTESEVAGIVNIFKSDQSVWFVGHDYLYQHDGSSWHPTPITDPKATMGVTSAAMDQQKRIWMATSGTIIAFDLRNRRPITQKPRISMLRATSGSQQLAGMDWSLEANHEPVSIDVRALSFVNEKRNRIEYQLEGPNTVRQATHTGSIQLGHLASGMHKLKVWSLNSERIQCTDPLTIQIQVADPFWATTLFWLLMVGLLLILSYLGMLVLSGYRTRQLRKWNKQLQYELEEQTRALVQAKSVETAHAMSVTLSHEVTQPLAAIQGSLDLLKIKNPEHEPHYNRMQAAIDGISSLLRRLRAIERVRLADYTPGVKMLALETPPDKPQAEPQGTILFVDDDTMLLDIWRDYFTETGWHVLTAENAEQGYNCLKQHESDINLIISDNKMPGLTGYEFYKMIRQSHPNIPFYIFTGYDYSSELTKELRQSLSGIIHKPIRLNDLYAIVERHKTCTPPERAK
ncbi:MAG: response regulator [Acidobacteria bacterium]|nr:response regulator [Acidobacteriota bacterium]